MKERPILFSGEMVQAILDGRKTKTRRVIKPQPSLHNGCTGQYFLWMKKHDIRAKARLMYQCCPYGLPGDRLWVRENWAVHPTQNRIKPSELRRELPVVYRADRDVNESHFWWRPSIFMPRWASRITLEITGVRVERLHEIAEADIYAEGFQDMFDGKRFEPAGYHFKTTWNLINAKRGYSWDSNPWVWVIEFRKS